jgi:hypothetical protein
MESDDDYVCAALVTMTLIKERIKMRRKRCRRRRLLWTQPWISNRLSLGAVSLTGRVNLPRSTRLVGAAL